LKKINKIYINLFTHFLDEKSWLSATKSNAQRFKNECHSFSRFNCYKTVTTEVSGKITEDSHLTATAHLFYNSVDCAQDVLLGSYIKYSLVAVLFILGLMF
jgi:hypothetical protein